MANISKRDFDELDARVVALYELVGITMAVLCMEKPFSAPQKIIGMLESSMSDRGHNKSTVTHLKTIVDWLSESSKALEVQKCTTEEPPAA